jgi:hypothetical protein
METTITSYIISIISQQFHLDEMDLNTKLRKMLGSLKLDITWEKILHHTALNGNSITYHFIKKCARDIKFPHAQKLKVGVKSEYHSYG